jgi:regulator of replication initiation timing
MKKQNKMKINKKHLCKNCYTEWVSNEEDCITCKEMEERRLNKLSEFMNNIVNNL